MKRPVLRLSIWGGVGDAILHTPAIRSWKQQNPSGRLIVRGPRSICDALRHNPHIDSLQIRTWVHRLIAGLPPVRRWLFRNVRMASYGLLSPDICYRNRHASSLIAELLGVRIESTSPEIHLTAEECEAMRSRMAKLAMPVAIHTSGTCTSNKNWLPESWAALVRENPQYDFIQLGLRKEPLVPGVHDMRGLSLRESFAVTRLSRAFVGIDSGPAHAAVALGVPTVVLFGPTVPDIWGHEAASNLYTQRRCSPCLTALYVGKCPYGRACMSSISVRAVSAELEKKLKSPQSPCQ